MSPYGRDDPGVAPLASCRQGVQKKTKRYIEPSKIHDTTANDAIRRSSSAQSIFMAKWGAYNSGKGTFSESSYGTSHIFP